MSKEDADDGIEGVQSLTSTNCRIWKIEIAIYLEGKGLLDIVNGTAQKPTIPEEIPDWYTLTIPEKIAWVTRRGIPGVIPANGRQPTAENLEDCEDRYEKDQAKHEKNIIRAQEKLEKYNKDVAKARGILYKSVSRHLRPSIAAIKEPSEIYKHLVKEYDKTNNSTNNRLRKELETPYVWGENFDKLLANWENIITQLKENGYPVVDQDMNNLLVATLPKQELAIYLDRLGDKMDEKVFEHTEFISKIRAGVNKRIQQAEAEGGVAYRVTNTQLKNQTKSKDTEDRRNLVCSHCHRRGHTDKTCWDKHPHLRNKKNSTPEKRKAINPNDETEQLRKRIKELEGQKAAALAKKKAKSSKGKAGTVSSIGLMAIITELSTSDEEEDPPAEAYSPTRQLTPEADDEEDKVEVALIQGPTANYEKGLLGWNMDSCCSKHMGANKLCFDFINPLPGNRIWVTVGNGAQIEAKGVGNVTLKLIKKPAYKNKKGVYKETQYGTYTFQDVLYVPRLMANLISTTQLANKGVTTVLLGRRKCDKDSKLKGGAINCETNETLFTMSSTSQGIYSLDIVEEEYLPAMMHEVTHDDSIAFSEEEFADESDMEMEETVTEKEPKSRTATQEWPSTVESTTDPVSQDWPSPTDSTNVDPLEHPWDSTYCSISNESTNPYDSVSTTDVDTFEVSSELQVYHSKTTETKIDAKHDRHCPHDHDIETSTFEKLWHARLAHPHSNVLKTIGHTATFPDAKRLRNPTIHRAGGCCAGCAYGKHKRRNRHGRPAARRTTTLYEIVHVDTVGPIQPPAQKKNYKYFQLFVEDSTRYVTIAFSTNKLDVLSNLKTFNNITSANGNPIRRIRSDRGTELLNSASEAYFKETGIIHEKTAAYTQHQNGTCGRSVQTITTKANTLLHTAGAPLNLWHYANAYACWLHNRLPSSVNPQRQSPYRMMYGYEPDLSLAKVWGCDAYSINHLRKKFEPKAKKFAFVGIEGEDSPNYILFDPRRKQTTVSTSVVFDEAKFTVMEELSGRKAPGIDLNQGKTFPNPDLVGPPQ